MKTIQQIVASRGELPFLAKTYDVLGTAADLLEEQGRHLPASDIHNQAWISADGYVGIEGACAIAVGAAPNSLPRSSRGQRSYGRTSRECGYFSKALILVQYACEKDGYGSIEAWTLGGSNGSAVGGRGSSPSAAMRQAGMTISIGQAGRPACPMLH